MHLRPCLIDLVKARRDAEWSWELLGENPNITWGALSDNVFKGGAYFQ